MVREARRPQGSHGLDRVASGAATFRRAAGPLRNVMHDPTNQSGSGHYASPSSTSTSLLDRVRARNQSAWRHLVDLYGPLVYGWCRRAGLREEDAADVTQDVFLAVARNFDRYEHDGPNASFRGWLRTITSNKINDLFRRRASGTQRPGQTVGASSGSHASDRRWTGSYQRPYEPHARMVDTNASKRCGAGTPRRQPKARIP